MKHNTIVELKTDLLIRMQDVKKHTYKKTDEIAAETDSIRAVRALYLYAQYLERKAFEMRLHIDEYIAASNGRITDATAALPEPPPLPEGTVPTFKSKVDDIVDENDSPF